MNFGKLRLHLLHNFVLGGLYNKVATLDNFIKKMSSSECWQVSFV